MPRPGPTPSTRPALPARAPPASIAGLNTRAANGPAEKSPIGTVNWAIMRRTAKTLPWTSCGVLLCQIAWLEALITGIVTYQRRTPAPTSHKFGRRPTSTKHTLSIAQPPSRPWMRRLVPPVVLISRPPSSMPTPTSDITVPTAASLAKASTIGMTATPPIAAARLKTAKNSSRRRRPGRSRMNVQPKAASFHSEPLDLSPSSLRSGRGMLTASSAPAAHRKVAKSMIRILLMPIAYIRNPAIAGAAMVTTAWPVSSTPLILP